jgi:hypothetical protein
MLPKRRDWEIPPYHETGSCRAALRIPADPPLRPFIRDPNWDVRFVQSRTMSARPANWFSLVSDCLAAAERDQVGSSCPVVDHEVVVPPGGGPADIEAWCICRTPDEKRQFVDHEKARFSAQFRRRLLAAGFPEEAMASLTIRVASRLESVPSARLG